MRPFPACALRCPISVRVNNAEEKMPQIGELSTGVRSAAENGGPGSILPGH